MRGTVHILCAVRDRQCLRSLIADMDDGETCIFDIVTSGRQALDRCRKVPPDILVIDTVLPEMDGLGVVEYLPFRAVYDIPLTGLLAKNGTDTLLGLLPKLGIQLFWCVALTVCGNLFWNHAVKKITVNGG